MSEVGQVQTLTTFAGTSVPGGTPDVIWQKADIPLRLMARGQRSTYEAVGEVSQRIAQASRIGGLLQ